MQRSSNLPHSSTPVNNLEEILKCVICYDKSVDARMCPFCSKLCCKTCIRKWLTENRSQCPHCRSSLRFEQLVSCRFVNEITQALETLTTPKPDLGEKCSEHECPLNYYCSTCSIAICSDCAMFSSTHQGHEFKHLSSVYNQHLQQINSESRILNKRILDLEAILNNAETSIDKLKTAKEEKRRELEISLDQMQARLDEQLKEKTAELGIKRDEVNAEIRKLKSMQADIDRELTQISKTKLISKSSDLIRKLQNTQYMSVSKFEIESIDCEFLSEVVPKYETGVFELKNYLVAQLSTEVVYSEVANYNGLLWRLKVYPNGNGVAKGNYLSVFLELLQGYGESSKYEYRVEMVNHLDPSQMVIREFASDFETGECWGYNRFFKIDQLKEEGYLSEEDTLVMKFFVRAPTYYQLYKDQRQYIKHLLEKENAYQAKILKFSSKVEECAGEAKEAGKDCESVDIEKEESRKEEEILRENVANPTNELSTMMQKYLMSPGGDSSDEELAPIKFDWDKIQDIPDFHSYSDYIAQELDSPDEQEYWPLG